MSDQSNPNPTPNPNPNSSHSPQAIAQYYDSHLAAHGDTAQGAGWPNEADRQTRFGVMRDLAGFGAPMTSVCDVACGTGAFLGHLQDLDQAPEQYLGLDISGAAIATAQQKYGPGLFRQVDLMAGPADGPADGPAVGAFDYVLANGLFTVKDVLSQDEMWDFMTGFLPRMWQMCRVGMAFNVMSAVVDWQRDDLFHVPSDRLLDFLYKMAGRRVVLRSDYDLYEYTVYVYRQPLLDRRP